MSVHVFVFIFIMRLTFFFNLLYTVFFFFFIYRIDRTLKLYIGGKQVRPDANYSRPVLSGNGKVIGQVGEANRKDVRDAVDIACKALPG